jgi:hypothetical protein
MFKYKILSILCILLCLVLIIGCNITTDAPRLSMFVGVDISGSFVNSGYYQDSINFLAYYIYSHLNGYGGLEIPRVLFVSSIGGGKADEPKTFYPIQTFQHKSIKEIKVKLHEIFPRKVQNPYTDYNAFFEQVALYIKNKKLVLRPVSIVMLSDGQPDVKREGVTDFKSIVVKPLENLSRNVTIRLLYTDAVVGKNWQTKVKRIKVKVWTQDALVMKTWKDPDILIPDLDFTQQKRFFSWLKDNVDFNVRSFKVD